MEAWPRRSRTGVRFVPLVNGYFKLACRLDILFLRRDAPGNLINGGDIDNRLKVLLDALSLPTDCSQVYAPEPGEDPFFCVMEDDSLISALSVVTDRLLAPSGEGSRDTDVELVIQVTTIALEPGVGNWTF